MRDPGRLLASGREADIYEYRTGLVLRRSRTNRSMEPEAQIMQYLHDRGFPVPAVDRLSDDGTDLVMERIDGPSMVEAIRRAPWTVRHQARTLAELHERLHGITAPTFLGPAPIGAGERILHLDLHPLNVIIGARGPVVIDWANTVAGDPDIDVALAWVLMAAGQVPGPRVTAAVLGWARGLLVNGFVDRFDRAQVAGRLREVVGWKVQDPHMSAQEIGAMWDLVKRAEARLSG